MNLLAGLSWVWTSSAHGPAETCETVGSSVFAGNRRRFSDTDGLADTYDDDQMGTSQRV